MSFVRGFPSGAGFNDLFTAAEYNVTDVQWLRAADFVSGSTLVMDGTAPVDVDVTLSQFVLASGSTNVAFLVDGTTGQGVFSGRLLINTATAPAVDFTTYVGGDFHFLTASTTHFDNGSSGNVNSGGSFSWLAGSAFTSASTNWHFLNASTTTFDSGANAIWSSGAGATISAGASLGVGGTLSVTGTLTVSAAVLQCIGASTITLGSSSTTTAAGALNNTGTVTNTGTIVNSGVGHRVDRYVRVTSATGTHFSVSSSDMFRVPSGTISGDVTYVMDNTSVANGVTLHWRVDSTHVVTLMQSDGTTPICTVSATSGSGHLHWVLLVWDSTEVAWVIQASETTV